MKPVLVVSLLARVISSLTYSITNEIFQTGNLNPQNFGTYALDATEDALISTFYFKGASALTEKILPPFAGDVLKKSTAVAISGVLDFGIDSFQTSIYRSSLPRTMRSLVENFGRSLRFNIPSKIF